MQLIKSEGEVLKLYIETYSMLNNYIKQWIGSSLKMNWSNEEIKVHIDLLSSLFNLFRLSGSH